MISQQVNDSSSRNGRLSLHQSVPPAAVEKPSEGSLSPSQRTTFDAAHSGGRGRQSAAVTLTTDSKSQSWFRSKWHQNGTISPESSKMEHFACRPRSGKGGRRDETGGTIGAGTTSGLRRGNQSAGSGTTLWDRPADGGEDATGFICSETIV
jgi:hypothetical protein